VRSVAYLFALILIIKLTSCGNSGENGNLNFKSTQGLSPQDLLGGVVVFATDGNEKLTYTFGSGQEFLNTQIEIPGGRQWQFRIFSWDGAGTTGTTNPNFSGRIRCGRDQRFVGPGEVMNIDIALTNSNCFTDTQEIQDPTQVVFDNAPNPNRRFLPFKLYNCSNNPSSISNYNDFQTSTCYLGSSIGPTRSYRIGIKSKTLKQEGLPFLISRCVNVNVNAAGTPSGTLFSNFNFPVGYQSMIENEIYPEEFEFELRTFKQANCTGDASLNRSLTFKDGLNGPAILSSTGNPNFKLIHNDGSNINLIFEDKGGNSTSNYTLSVTNTNAHPTGGQNGYINLNNKSAFTISGTCSPEGAQIQLSHTNSTYTYPPRATCSSSSFSLTVDASTVPSSEFIEDNASINEFRLDFDDPTTNVHQILYLGKDITVPAMLISPQTPNCINGQNLFNIALTDSISGITPASLSQSSFNSSVSGGATANISILTYGNPSVIEVTTSSGSATDSVSVNFASGALFTTLDLAGNQIQMPSPGSCTYQ
jgi:hypothetical protein